MNKNVIKVFIFVQIIMASSIIENMTPIFKIFRARDFFVIVKNFHLWCKSIYEFWLNSVYFIQPTKNLPAIFSRIFLFFFLIYGG